MSPCLEDCPDEIIEATIVLLKLDDVRSLRQSCRSLAVKTTQNRFKSYYHSKRVDITPHSLRAFVNATQSGRLGRLVQDLILVGLTNGAEGHNSEPQYGPAETELDLLSQAFNGIAANRKSGQLLSLSLEVAVVQDNAEQRLPPADVAIGGWKFVWQSAAQTFHTTLRALAASRLPLEKLGARYIAFELEILVYQLIGQNHWGSAYCLLLSASQEKEIREAKLKAMAQSNFIGLAKFLQITHCLDSLEIHYYRLDTARHQLKYSPAPHERLLKQLAMSKKQPKLKQCRLRGVYIGDGDLLAFIQRTATRRLFRENIFMSSGTFRPIFDYCTHETAGIEELYFDDLFEKYNMLYFCTLDHVGHAQVPLDHFKGWGRVSTSLQRVGAEIKL